MTSDKLLTKEDLVRVLLRGRELKLMNELIDRKKRLLKRKAVRKLRR